MTSSLFEFPPHVQAYVTNLEEGINRRNTQLELARQRIFWILRLCRLDYRDYPERVAQIESEAEHYLSVHSGFLAREEARANWGLEPPKPHKYVGLFPYTTCTVCGVEPEDSIHA